MTTTQEYIDTVQTDVNRALIAGKWADFYRAMTALAEHPNSDGDTVLWFWEGYWGARAKARRILEGDWSR